MKYIREKKKKLKPWGKKDKRILMTNNPLSVFNEVFTFWYECLEVSDR